MLSLLQSSFSNGRSSQSLPPFAGAVIVDVRTVAEFNQGHFPGATNFPLNEIRQNREAILKWNKPVITVCQSGQRSKLATALLHASGIEAYNGGAWPNLKKLI